MAERRKKKLIEEENFRGDAANMDSELDTSAKEVKLQQLKDAQAERLGFYPHAEGVDPIIPQTTATKRVHSMSMIDPTEWQLDNSQEPYALKDGSEVMLRIIDVRLDKRDDESEYYTVRMEVPSETYSKEITDWLNVPSRNLDAKRLNAARQKMLHFMECFSIDRTTLTDPLEDWVGQEGWAILSLSKSEQYGEQNRIAKYIVPR